MDNYVQVCIYKHRNICTYIYNQYEKRSLAIIYSTAAIAAGFVAVAVIRYCGCHKL